MSSADYPSLRIPFLSRVWIQDYKSIGNAHVLLHPLTVLVGRNGSGKSNFLDALRFVADSLQTSVDHAVRSRGVLYGISRRGVDPPRFYISLQIELPDKKSALYLLIVEILPSGEFKVCTESLIIQSESEILHHYLVDRGDVIGSTIGRPPAAQSDRLYLVAVSGFSEFRPVYDALTGIRLYDFNAEAMKKLQNPDVGGWLRPDGSNVASVVARLSTEQPEVLRRITQYLSAIVPGIVSIERVSLGPVETLKFIQQGGDSPVPYEFFAWSMSDGTLRALGSLVAVSQSSVQGAYPSLVGIEEPETSLHPAAAAALMEGLREATVHTQVLITSHSPDLLDQVDLDTDTLLAVALREGVTKIAPIDKASLSVIRRHLYTPGELLRLDQLEPDQEDLARQESLAPRGEGKEG
jgi:predicted ATPase